MSRLIKTMLIILTIITIPSVIRAQARFELPGRADVLELSNEIMHGEMGKTERNNRAAHVDAYNRSAGIPLGSPYCVSAVYWACSTACVMLNLPLSEIPVPRTGLARAVWNYGKKYGVRTEYLPARHDRIIYGHVGKITGHHEVIDLVLKNGWVQTLAFNTSSRDPRNGDANELKIRNVRAPLGRMQILGLVGFNTKGKR